MKAAVCHAFGQPLAVEEVDIAPPARGEIGVRVAACAICHSDIHYAEGAWGGTLPAVYGHEAAGVVEAVGPGVEGFATGDRVVVTLIRACGRCGNCAAGEPALCETPHDPDRAGPLTLRGAPLHQAMHTGAFAERVVVHATQAVIVDDAVPFDSAALLACGVITGAGAVMNTAAVRPGSDVAVIGCGGVGLNSIQGAVLCGARSVIALDVSEAKLDAARAFGATHVHDARDPDAAGFVRSITGGRGAGYVFVTVGIGAAVTQALGLAARGGTVVLVGMPASGDTVAMDPGAVAADGLRILGSRMGSARIATDIPRLIAFYHQGRLKLDELISGRYPLEAINEAIGAVNRGEALRNVIVF